MTQNWFTSTMMDRNAIYSKWPHTPHEVLMKTLNENQRTVFDRLEAENGNMEQCRTNLLAIYHNLSCSNFVGMDLQVNALSSCKKHHLNYVAAKVLTKIEKLRYEKYPNPEEASVNYYRRWFESTLQKEIGILDRISIYHNVSGSWLYSTYAALIGLTPIVFQKSSN